MCIGARDADHRFLTRTARETCGALEKNRNSIVEGRERKKNVKEEVMMINEGKSLWFFLSFGSPSE